MSSGKSKGKIVQFPLSPEKYIKTKARALPIRECLVNKDWQEFGMAHVIITRQQPSGNLTVGIFLVDMLCLGIKDCGYKFNIPEFEYLEMKKDTIKSLDAEPCEYGLAHNIIYGALEFAEELGFKPQKDWAVAQYLLAEDTDDIELIDLQFGDDEGRPRVVVTPEYPMQQVITHLNNVLGPGNFDIVDEDNNDIDEFDGDTDDFDFDPEDVEIPEELFFGEFIDRLYALHIYPEKKKVSPQLKAIKFGDYDFIDVVPKVGNYVFSEKEETMMEEMLAELNELSPGVVPKLEELVAEYPKNMVLQNYLCNAYSDAGQTEKAAKLIEASYRQFPWYVFARANYGHLLLDEKKTDDFVSLFDGVFDLKALYPERDGFHYLEVITFYTCIVRYYLMTEEIQNADFLMDFMERLFMHFADERVIKSRLMITDIKMLTMFASTDIPVKKALQAYKPRFRSKTIAQCYEGKLSFSPELFKEILAIEEEDLIHDLREGIVMNLRLAYLSLNEEGTSEHDDHHFMIYAYFLLAELDRPELLSDFLFLLEQSDEVLRILFGDMLAEYVWMPLSRLGKDQMPAMVAFCKELRDDFGQIVITETLVQIALNFPDYRDHAAASLLELVHYCLVESDESMIESDFVSDLVCQLADLQDPTLLPSIKALYDQDLVDFGYAGTYEEVEHDILNKVFPPALLHPENVFELWHDIQKNWK